MQHMDAPLEIKQLSDDGQFSGYASVAGNVDLGGDIVEPGAFSETLARFKAKGAMPKMLWQHEPSKVVGVWEEMAEDDKGLRVKGRLLTELQLGKEALVMLRAKALDGLSIGYRTVESDWDGPDARVRRLLKLDLYEVSLVTFPMNPEANITAVKRLDAIGDVERILRDAGVPNAFAKLVATYGYNEAVKRVTNGRREADASEKRRSVELSALADKINSLRSSLQ